MDCAGHEGEKMRGGEEEKKKERKRERERREEEEKRRERERERSEVRCVNSRSQWPFPERRFTVGFRTEFRSC